MIENVRFTSSQNSSSGQQQDWTKTVVVSVLGLSAAGVVYYMKTSNKDKDPLAMSQTREVVGNLRLSFCVSCTCTFKSFLGAYSGIEFSILETCQPVILMG